MKKKLTDKKIKWHLEMLQLAARQHNFAKEDDGENDREHCLELVGALNELLQLRKAVKPIKTCRIDRTSRGSIIAESDKTYSYASAIAMCQDLLKRD